MKPYKNYKHAIATNLGGITDKIKAFRKPFVKPIKKKK